MQDTGLWQDMDMRGVTATTILISIATFAVGFALSAWLSARGEASSAQAQPPCATVASTVNCEKDDRG